MLKSYECESENKTASININYNKNKKEPTMYKTSNLVTIKRIHFVQDYKLHPVLGILWNYKRKETREIFLIGDFICRYISARHERYGLKKIGNSEGPHFIRGGTSRTAGCGWIILRPLCRTKKQSVKKKIKTSTYCKKI